MIVVIRKTGKVEPVTEQTHDWQFRNWTLGLSPIAFQGICDAVNEYINREGREEIITSSGIPGSDWNSTPYQPIYEAVGRDWGMARFFFGLIVWRVMMDRPETWALWHYPRHHNDIPALTYFRVSVGEVPKCSSS